MFTRPSLGLIEAELKPTEIHYPQPSPQDSSWCNIQQTEQIECSGFTHQLSAVTFLLHCCSMYVGQCSSPSICEAFSAIRLVSQSVQVSKDVMIHLLCSLVTSFPSDCPLHFSSLIGCRYPIYSPTSLSCVLVLQSAWPAVTAVSPWGYFLALLHQIRVSHPASCWVLCLLLYSPGSAPYWSFMLGVCIHLMALEWLFVYH